MGKTKDKAVILEEKFLESVSPLTEEEAIRVYLDTANSVPFNMNGLLFRATLDAAYKKAIEEKRCKG